MGDVKVKLLPVPIRVPPDGTLNHSTIPGPAVAVKVGVVPAQALIVPAVVGAVGKGVTVISIDVRGLEQIPFDDCTQ